MATCSAASSTSSQGTSAIGDIINAVHDMVGFLGAFKSPSSFLDGTLNYSSGLGSTSGDGGQVQAIVQGGISGQPPSVPLPCTPPAGMSGAGSVTSAVTGFNPHTMFVQAWNTSAGAAMVVAGVAALALIAWTAINKPDAVRATALTATMKLVLVEVFIASGFLLLVMSSAYATSGDMGVAAFLGSVGSNGWNAVTAVLHAVIDALALSTALGLVISHLPVIGIVFKLLFIVFILNFLYLLILILMRWLILAFAFGTAPLILPIGMMWGWHNRLVQWWSGLFFGSLMAPLVLGFGLGLTINLTLATLQSVSPLALGMAMLILLGGTWFTHQSMQQLTFGAFGHHNATWSFVEGFLGGAGAFALARGVTGNAGASGGGSRGATEQPSGAYPATLGGRVSAAVAAMQKSPSPVGRVIGSALTAGNDREIAARDRLYDAVSEGMAPATGGLGAAVTGFRAARAGGASVSEGVAAAGGAFHQGAADGRAHRQLVNDSLHSRDRGARAHARVVEYLATSGQGQARLAAATGMPVGSYSIHQRETLARTVLSDPRMGQWSDRLHQTVGVDSMGETVSSPHVDRWALADQEVLHVDSLAAAAGQQREVRRPARAGVEEQ
jgi:hypothetical protein